MHCSSHCMYSLDGSVGPSAVSVISDSAGYGVCTCIWHYYATLYMHVCCIQLTACKELHLANCKLENAPKLVHQ